MKKIFTSVFSFLVLFFVILVPSTSAKVMSSQEGEIIVAKEEIINDDLFVGAQSATINGTINGDVFIGAQAVKIGGVINGNVHIGAQTVTITGSIKGSVYTGAQSVSVTSSKIGGSLITGSQSFNIDSKSTVGGSIIVGAASANIDSPVKRNVMVGAGILTIGESATIGKDLYYATGKENEQTIIADRSKVAGEIHRIETGSAQEKVNISEKDAIKFFAGAKVASSIISFLGALIIGLIAMKLFASFMTGTAARITKSFGKSLGIGFLIVVATIPGIIILLITIIGIPVAGIYLVLLGLYTYLAKIVVGNALGKSLSNKFNWKIGSSWTFVIGLLLIYLLKAIPFVGTIIGIVTVWVGLGAIAIHIFSKKE